MVDRYGESIEYDLHLLGLDLLDFFRGRYSWRKLANIVRRVASTGTTHTGETMADDDDIAEMILDQPKGPDTGPRLSEYSLVVARLDTLADRLGELISLTVQVNSEKKGSAPKIKPIKRPETAVTRAERRRARVRYNSLVDEVKAAQERFAARAG